MNEPRDKQKPVTRFRCTACGKLTAGRLSRDGGLVSDTTHRYPRRHRVNGQQCPGSIREAEWVDVLVREVIVPSPESDDNEKITPEWLRLIGFEQNRPCHVHETPDCNWWSDQHKLEIWQFNDTDEYLWVEYDRVGMTRRRDLRLLIEWAGVRSR